MDPDKLVMPGEVLCTEEEYLPSHSVYAEGGNIYAATLGKVEMKDGKVSVVNLSSEVDRITRGMLVIGEVVSEVGKVMFVKVDDVQAGNKRYAALSDGKIIGGDRRGHQGRGGREPSGKLCREGDIVLAMVDAVEDGIYTLAFYGPETGVVYSRCGSCGNDMRYDPAEKALVCDICDKGVRSKVSSLYGKPNEIKSLLAKGLTQ
jgi:exosome complex component CSL4